MARILLVGSDRHRASGVRSLLRRGGHQVTWSRSPGDWRESERRSEPDVVVAAVDSPEASLESRGGGARRGFPPPVLFVQQESDLPRELHEQERLVDRISSPFTESELAGRVDALVQVRQIVLRQESGGLPAWKKVGRSSRGLLSWLSSKLPDAELPVGQYMEVAARVADWADRRDAFRPGHAERVTAFSAMIAEGLGMDADQTSELLRAAMLHDIGKVALPVEVLHQRGPLDESQLRLIRTHPARGAALLRVLDPDKQMARVVLYHHERPDGSGYYGKPVEAVPRASLVLAVAEAYDAMTASLVQEPLTSEEALDLLRSMRGERYDADCVDALVDQLQPQTVCIPLSRGPISGTKFDPWL